MDNNVRYKLIVNEQRSTTYTGSGMTEGSTSRSVILVDALTGSNYSIDSQDLKGLQALVSRLNSDVSSKVGSELRESVAWFANEMEDELMVNDHKPGWEGIGKSALFRRVQEELKELEDVLFAKDFKYNQASIDHAISECADAACFLMMIADNLRKEPVKTA